MAEGFSGFPAGTSSFLRAIGRNNSKPWFDAHRDEYERYYLEPAQEFVIALGAKLKRISSDVHAEPWINGSIMRINRDIRFSKDKRPYKDHLAMWFWEGRDRKGPGYWMSLAPSGFTLGVGLYMLERDRLERYRRAVADPKTGGALAGIVRSLRRSRYKLGGETYKRVPPGYDVGDERAELLKHAGIYAWTQLPASATRSRRFVETVAKHCKAIAPLQEWLIASLGYE